MNGNSFSGEDLFEKNKRNILIFSCLLVLLGLLGAGGGTLVGLVLKVSLALSNDGGAALDGLLELGGAAEGHISEVGADGSDGLGGVGGLSTGGLLGPDLVGLVGVGAVLGVDGDFLLVLDADDGGLLVDVASVALGGLTGVVEGVVGHADTATLLEVLVAAAGEHPGEIGGDGRHFF